MKDFGIARICVVHGWRGRTLDPRGGQCKPCGYAGEHDSAQCQTNVLRALRPSDAGPSVWYIILAWM